MDLIVCGNSLTNKIEKILNTKLPDLIDDDILRGIYIQNSYKILYNELNDFKYYDDIKKAKFEGIIDDYFSKHKLRINNSIQLYVDNKSNNNSNITSVNGPIYPDSYPICGNACMDCCEDMCEHAICCNCFSVVYDVWDESLDAGNNNKHNYMTAQQIQKYLQGYPMNNSNNITNDGDIVHGCCDNPCEDGCEDICEHAICCNCSSNLISQWIEKEALHNANNMNNIQNIKAQLRYHPIMVFEREAIKKIEEGKRFCKRLLAFIFISVIFIAVIILHFVSK